MKTMMVFIMAVFSFVFYLGWFVTMPEVTYTEKDFFKYYLLTHKEIRNAPRLTDDYYFEYGPSDLTEPTQSTMYICGLDDVDAAYENLASYINETAVPFTPAYEWETLPKRDGGYFSLGKRYRGGSEPCLMLVFTEDND